MKAFLVLAFLFLGGVACGEEQPNFLVIYQVRVFNPNSSYLMVCPPEDPGCNAVYDLEERHIQFRSSKAALAWMNGKAIPCEPSEEEKQAGIFCFAPYVFFPWGFQEAPKPHRILGLYCILPIALVETKVGEYEAEETQRVKVKKDKLEWQIRESPTAKETQ